MPLGGRYELVDLLFFNSKHETRRCVLAQNGHVLICGTYPRINTDVEVPQQLPWHDTKHFLISSLFIMSWLTFTITSRYACICTIKRGSACSFWELRISPAAVYQRNKYKRHDVTCLRIHRFSRLKTGRRRFQRIPLWREFFHFVCVFDPPETLLKHCWRLKFRQNCIICRGPFSL